MAVIFCYLNQITFFLGCLTIHERRVQAGRHCLTCRRLDENTGDKAEDVSCIKSCCCTGRRAKSRLDYMSFLEKLPQLVLPKFVLFNPVKVCTLVAFFAYIGCSVWGAINLEQGLNLKNLVSEDSYFYKYSSYDLELFPTKVFVSFVTEYHQNYSSSSVIERHKRLLADIESTMQIDSVFDWYSLYTDSMIFDNSTEEEFCRALHTKFLATRGMYTNDVKFDTNYSRILSSRFHVLTKNVKSSYNQGKLMEEMREIANSYSVFAYSPSFIYYEQYVAVLPDTLQTVGLAVGAIFLVTCVFIPHPLMIVLVTLSMASVMLGVLGFMHYWGLSLSSITMVLVILSVGFSVDFSAHICHAYISSKEIGRNAKVNNALLKAGGPIFNAAMSSIIGIITLVFSKSFVFRSFFKVMLLVVLFGFLHGLLVLPVILSLIGPRSQEPQTEKCPIYQDKINQGFQFTIDSNDINKNTESRDVIDYRL